jgi:hypothetical protein
MARVEAHLTACRLSAPVWFSCQLARWPAGSRLVGVC